MRRASAHSNIYHCEVCRNQLLPDRKTPGTYISRGDWMQACHDAMNHIRATGHEPVTVISSSTAVYGMPEDGKCRAVSIDETYCILQIPHTGSDHMDEKRRCWP